MSLMSSLCIRLLQPAFIGCLLLMCGCSTFRDSLSDWGPACGDGRIAMAILDDFDLVWKVPTKRPLPALSVPVVDIVPGGCHGNAMSYGYDLRKITPDGQSWVVLERTFLSPKDLSNYTHIRVAIQGSILNSHDAIELKL